MEQKILEKNLDREGRVLLPKAWRQKYGKKLIIIQTEKELRILPHQQKYFSEMPEIKVNIKSLLTDWHGIKKEILLKR